MDAYWNLPIAAKSDEHDTTQWLPLWIHSMDTAEIMLCLWDKWLPRAAKALLCNGEEEEGRRLCRLLGLIHDIGKASVGFQHKIQFCIEGLRDRLAEKGFALPCDDPGDMPHAHMSEVILRFLGCEKGVAAVAGAHHGKPQESVDEKVIRTDFDKYYRPYFDKQENQWQGVWESIFSDALRTCGYGGASELPKLTTQKQMALSGLLIMADWIASNPYYFPLIPAQSLGAGGLYPARTAAGWNKIKLPGFWQSETAEFSDSLFHERFGYFRNTVQRMMTTHAGGGINRGYSFWKPKWG